jgi:hypothetical protein
MRTAHLFRVRAWCPLTAVLAAAMLVGCDDSLRPEVPLEPDHSMNFDSASRTPTTEAEQYRPDQSPERMLQSAGQWPARYTAVWQRSAEDEIQIYGATEVQYRAKYNQLWQQGWRLKLLDVYSVGEGPRYTAVWHRSTEDEIGMYGQPQAAFVDKNRELGERGYGLKLLDVNIVSNKLLFTAVWDRSSEKALLPTPGLTYQQYVNWYGAFWNAGYRLKLLDLHFSSGEPRFTGVWHPSTEDQIGMYGETYDRYRAKYDELWQQGYRLKALDIDFVSNGQPRYSAVWHQSSEAEIQVYRWTYEEYRAKYDQLWKQGWRLKLLKVSL